MPRRRHLPEPKGSVYTFGDVMYQGIDLARVAALAMELPSARGLKWVKNMRIRRSTVMPDTSAWAWDDRRITVEIGYAASIGNVVGTILHEMAHLACMARKQPWDDSSPQFATCCHALHAEWNQLHGNIVRVCVHVTGAYEGDDSKFDLDAATIPVWIGVTKPPPGQRLRIKPRRWLSRRYWGPILTAGRALGAETVSITLGGTLADEIELMYVDAFDGEDDELRELLVRAWSRAEVRRHGSTGRQVVINLPGFALSELHEALEMACESPRDNPELAAKLQAQAAQVTDRMFTALALPVPRAA